MDNQTYKEVYFHEYCEKCKYKFLKENETPCSECLTETLNCNTHKPVKYEEKSIHERSE